MSSLEIGVLVALYFFIGIIFIIFLYKKNKEYCPSYRGWIFGMILYYIVVPSITLLNIDEMKEIELAKGKYSTNSIQRFIIDGEFSNKIFAIVVLLLMFLSFNLAYSYSDLWKKYIKKINLNKMGKFIFEKLKLSKIKKYISKRLKLSAIIKRLFKKENVAKCIAYITFVVGLISLIIVFVSYGGIKEALSNAESLRGFGDEEYKNNSGIFIFLSKLIIVSPFMLVYLLSNRDENKKKNIKYITMLIISLAASLLYFLFNAGKAPLLFFGLCFLYMILNKKVKNTWLVIIGLAILALPLLDILDTLYYWFVNGKFSFKEINYIKYVSKFMHPYKNSLILNELVNEYGLRYGKDFITAFLDILPGVSFDASYVNTSRYIVGENWRTLGGVPNDFITFGFIQFSWIGVMILSALAGILSRILDNKLLKAKDNSAKRLFAATLTVYMFSLIPSADFVGIIKGGGYILISVALIILFSNKETKA